MFAKQDESFTHNRSMVQIICSVCLLLAFACAVEAATFTVTTAADNGDNANPIAGSLRAAIISANNNPDTDTIAFNIGSGLQTIQPLSQLPNITNPVIVDGTTQPGFAGAPLIELNGSNAGNNSTGLVVTSNTGSTIRGLVINRFANFGIQLGGNGGHLVVGNYIGTNATGSDKFPLPNNGIGIAVSSPNNVIGGTSTEDRNIISGNRNQAVSIGIDILGTNDKGNKVIGNYIGTDVTGTLGLGPVSDGIRLGNNASENLIGGATAVERNVISGNFTGVEIGGGAHHNKVQGNYFGTKADGTGQIGGSYGLFISVDANNNLIGGTNPGEGNLISGVTNRGVVVTGDATINNAILGNSITSDNLGIDLKFDGLTANDYGATMNDPSDADTGANNLQNFPVINSVSLNGGNTLFNGTLRSEANKTYRIEIFSNTFCNASGYGAGQFFIGATNISTDASGNANFNLSAPTGSITGPFFTATATDPANNTSEFSQCQQVANPGALKLINGPYNVGEGNGQATITVARTGGSLGAISVHYQTFDNTALAGQDYTPVSGTLNWADGDTSNRTVNIPVINDNLDEPNENALIVLNNPTGGAVVGLPSSDVFTIIDDDPPPTVSINDVGQSEGNSGTTNFTFMVTLSAASGKAVSMNYETAGGTAAPGNDFQPASGTLTFVPGEISKPVTVIVNGDSAVEPDETFFVNLSNPTNATFSKIQGSGTITNDDVAQPGNLQFSSAVFSGSESSGLATVTVKRINGSDNPVSVQYATVPGGTATTNSDYTPTSGTLNWADGDSANKSFIIPIVNDSLNEAVETIKVQVSNPTGGAVLAAPTEAIVNITDNDPTPSLSINDVSQAESNSGVTNFNFSVTLSEASGQSVTVQYATADGSALLGNDYQPANGTLTFLPGETSKPVTVMVNGDGAVEPDETFFVNLSNPTSVTIGKAQGVGTIVNDDSPSAPAIQFSTTGYVALEDSGSVTVTVTRNGDVGAPSTVEYRTTDTDTFTVGCAAKQGAAFGRCDFATTVGTLNFAAGETSKTFAVPIINDSYSEGSETFGVSLSNPTGAMLGAQTTAVVTITDNEAADGPNPVFSPSFFVRQHYLDFLGREPEPGEPWSGVLNGCPDPFNVNPNSPSAPCDRITVSGAFFGSPEFKDKGIYLIDFYRVALNRLPLYAEFAIDQASVTGATAADANAKRAAFANKFVQRTEFINAYGAMTNSQYVNALMSGTLGQNYNLASITTFDPMAPDGPTKLTLTTSDLINALNSNTLTRAQVLRAVVQSDQVSLNLEAVNAFVASQYYGYLRRTPDTAGFNGWVDYLKNNPNDFRTMVNGFVNSKEYTLRFGPQ